MKISNFKFIKIAFVVLAFTFSSNMNATVSSNANTHLSVSQITSTTLYSGGLSKIWGKIAEKIKKIKKTPKSNSQKPRIRKRNLNQCKPTKKVPLDGGISFLVLGAAAFGVSKLRRK